MLYEKSQVFRECRNNQGEIEAHKMFQKILTKYGIQKNYVEHFLKNYKIIWYNKYNINNYVNIISELKYDIENDFYDMIISKYVLNDNIKKENLKLVSNQHIIKRIKYICSNPNKITHNQLLNIIYNICDIRELNLIGNGNITNTTLKHLDLDVLIAFGNICKISDEGIKHMQLKILDASGNKKITDEGIKHMQLEKLYAIHNENITNDGIKHMQLHTLYTGNKSRIDNDGIKNMYLHTLNARGSNITNEGIKHMYLNTLIVPFSKITVNGVRHMKLSKLDTKWNRYFYHNKI